VKKIETRLNGRYIASVPLGGYECPVNIINSNTLDEETRQLILELQAALNERDVSLTQRLISALPDKSIDLVIALVAGQILK
jgi:hypothetical protein